jgi:hypothetical protein
MKPLTLTDVDDGPDDNAPTPPAPDTPGDVDVEETTGGLLCGNSPFGIRDSRQVPNCMLHLPPLHLLDIALVSMMTVLFRLSWSDRCVVCPLSLHRHSTRGSFPFPFALLWPLTLLILLFLLLFLVDQSH